MLIFQAKHEQQETAQFIRSNLPGPELQCFHARSSHQSISPSDMDALVQYHRILPTFLTANGEAIKESYFDVDLAFERRV